MLANKILNFKSIENDYDRAYQLVDYLFQDIKDKAGVPYINHLVCVSEMLDSCNTRIAGLLHDVVEDISDFTLEDLKLLGFSDAIVEIVRIVTKDKTGEKSYHDWITEIIDTKNIEAIKVKYADIMDHLDIERLNRLSDDKKRYFMDKYQGEAKRLEKVLFVD